MAFGWRLLVQSLNHILCKTSRAVTVVPYFQRPNDTSTGMVCLQCYWLRASLKSCPKLNKMCFFTHPHPVEKLNLQCKGGCIIFKLETYCVFLFALVYADCQTVQWLMQSKKHYTAFWGFSSQLTTAALLLQRDGVYENFTHLWTICME